ncbi:MAG TPA: VOC family protein [Candidatus Acidoferrum sp.]|nr:VOC family protein [Candidatus Acidoferrum sp.]
MQTMIAVLLLAVTFFSPQPDSSPALAGIAHVAYRVADVQISRDFYQSLGFEQAFEFTDPGKPPVSYIKINDRQFIELYGRSNESQTTGLLHVCYEAADIESLWNEYVKHGLHPPRSRKARAGNLLFVLHDPEGQTLEYTQYLPGSLHFDDRGKHLGDRRVSQHLLRAVIPVQNVDAEHGFYTSKLAFRDVVAEDTIRLRLPGNSGDEIALEATTPATKPIIVFTVANLARAADRLRSRSLAVKTGKDSISVIDPDGAIILFTSEMSESRVKP